MQMEYTFKQFIKTLLNYYVKLEEESTDDEKYYTNSEGDSNVTVFEGLSNGNRLGLVSKLNLEDAKIVLLILNSILSEIYRN